MAEFLGSIAGAIVGGLLVFGVIAIPAWIRHQAEIREIHEKFGRNRHRLKEWHLRRMEAAEAGLDPEAIPRPGLEPYD